MTSSENEHHIWNPETGITAVEVEPDALSASEILGIAAVWTSERERLQGSAQLSQFTERLSREWAIETGVIENLYEIERGVTQTLVEQGFQSELLFHGSTNKPREYVIQLLKDQQNALEGVFDFVKNERGLSVSYIKELHAALLRSQRETEAVDTLGRPVTVELIKGKWKTQANYPVRDGVTYTYCPPEQVASEMDRLVAMHDGHVAAEVPFEVQAAWLHHRFTQIHPFQDGNGRVARALASLVLIKGGLFPLVVTRDEKSDYLDALEKADAGDLGLLIKLIVRLQITQYRKATAISMVVAEEGTEAALVGLQKEADRLAAQRRESFKAVFEFAGELEQDLESRLEKILPEVESALRKVSDRAHVFVKKYTDTTDHYFRAQIIKNARENMDYFVDTSEYRSWVALHMQWSRRAKLVFAIHGIGRPFNGSLICAPFLEFKDEDEDRHVFPDLVPVSEDGFIFFYNETLERMLTRFRAWQEEVLTVAIRELTQNL